MINVIKNSYCNNRKTFCCCCCYMFNKIIIGLVCSFCLWQKILQRLGSEQDRLWELHGHNLYKKRDTRRSWCGSIDGGKDILLYHRRRLLLSWNESCRGRPRIPNTCTISISFGYDEIWWWFYFAINVHMLRDYCCKCCLCEFGFSGVFVRNWGCERIENYLGLDYKLRIYYVTENWKQLE